jgi:predicted MFS family arabinose efflux permease
LFSSAWAVGISPGVAERTTARNRAFGFSLLFSSGIGLGVVGGFFGGHLPGWFTHGSSLPDLHSYRAALATGCALVLLAMWPLARMKSSIQTAAARKLFRPSPLLLRILIATAVWNFGTGAFNPFFNAYFARMGVAVGRIGATFAVVQVVQASAMLLAPIALRRIGMVRGVSAMQAATGIALLFLAAARTPFWAGAAYASYMTAQYACEPGMYAFLMDAVPEGERAGASALNFVAIFAAQAVAQAMAGVLFMRFGYPPVLAAAAVICIAGATLFRILLAKAPSHDPVRA